MKKILVLLFCFTSGMIYGQKWAVKTNAAYWATTTLNIGGEMALAPRQTLDLTATYNPFRFSDNKRSCIGQYNPNGVTGPAGVLWDISSAYMPMEENTTEVWKNTAMKVGLQAAVYHTAINGSSENTGIWKQKSASDMHIWTTINTYGTAADGLSIQDTVIIGDRPN